MKIEFIPQYRNFGYIAPKTENNKTTPKQKEQYNYNPIVYRDFNVSFGERLFRTPQNFYEQEFNEKGMPKMLHEYIYESIDSDFRKTIPPAQAMQEVYGSLKYAQSLDQVKLIYPQEPLFKDLHSKSSKKAREGVLGELSLLKSDKDYIEKSLFKNGNDDLGLYILKKIYVEGKTLKEINKDFHRDTSVVYEGLGDIKYSDLKAFGIHFPNNSFWKSFVATRSDFPYVYIPRKAETIKKNNQTTSKINLPKPKKHTPRYTEIKDWEVDKIAKAIEESNGGIEDIKKRIRKTSNSENNNFVAKYMGEIMSVTLERLHASPEMKSFFEDYENTSISQKSILKKYWTTPNARQNLSLVMKSTIQMFMDAYDEDGENDEFKELLDYAHNIKPLRLEQEEKHAQKQIELEETFSSYVEPEDEVKEIEQEVEPKVSEDEFQQKLLKNARMTNSKMYPFKLSNGVNLTIVSNLKEMLEDKLSKDLSFYPKEYRDKYVDFILKESDDIYLLSLFYNIEGLEEMYDFTTSKEGQENDNAEICALLKKEYFMPTEEINKKTAEISEKFNKKHPLAKNAIDQSLKDVLSKYVPVSEKKKQELIEDSYKYFVKNNKDTDMSEYALRLEAIKDIENILEKASLKNISYMDSYELNTILELFTTDRNQTMKEVKEKFDSYNKPLTNKEIRRIQQQITQEFTKYNPKKSSLNDSRTKIVFDTMAENLRQHKNLRGPFVQVMNDTKQIKETMGDYRVFLDPSANEDILMAKTELFMIKFINECPDIRLPLAAYDKKILEQKMRFEDPELYNHLMILRIKTGMQQ